MNDFIFIENREYNRPEFWPFMPEEIFDALEAAELKGAAFGETIKAKVSKSAFDRMMAEYKRSKK